MVLLKIEPPLRFGFLVETNIGVERRLEGDGIVSRTVGCGYASVSSQWFFGQFSVRRGKQWTPQRLAWTGVLMAWGEGQTLAARWEQACEAAGDLHRHWKLGTSYSGFIQAWNRSASTLIPAICRRFQRQMKKTASRHWRVRGWLAFTVDGTRLETPHVAANEDGLGCAGCEKSAPQVFLTTLWHMGLGLPWTFRVGPGTDSERHHMREMIGELPKKSLLVADAGFVGYELCRALNDAGQSFLLRVGGNITLLKELGYDHEERDGLVYLWPDKFRKSPPLVLRLIKIEQRGKSPIFLLTNVLDPQELSDEDAQVLYEMRWGVEVFYRSYKQTLDRRTLKSRTPETCLLEAQLTMLGLWLLGLMSIEQITKTERHPKDWSVAKSRDAVRRAIRKAKPRRSKRPNLLSELSAAVKDTYQRAWSKEARNYPHKKKQKPPSPPKIKPATQAQIQRAKRLRTKTTPKARTA